MPKKYISGAFAAFLLFFLFQLLVPAASFAHAYIIKSEPASGQALQTAPTGVHLLFNEAIDPSFFALSVLNDKGQKVSSGEPAIDADNPAGLSVKLEKDLPEGVYVARWRVISSDGHPISGTVPFAVGASAGDAAAALAAGDLTAGGAPGADQVIIRWLLYGGLMLLAGSLAFPLWLFPRAFRAEAFEMRSFRLLLLTGSILTALGILLSLPLQIRLETGANWITLWQGEWFRETLKDGLFGTIWWVETLLLLPLAFLVYALWSQDYVKRRRMYGFLALLNAAAIAAMKAMIGHPATAPSRLAASAADFLHLSAAAVWVGGLLVMAFVLPKAAARDESGTLAPETVRRFTDTGSISAVVLLFSGLYGSIIYLPDLNALFDTAYGWILIAKAAIMLVMLSFALVNFLKGRAKRRLGRAVKLEWAAGIAALILAAVLTNLSPGAPKGGPYEHSETAKSGYTTLIDVTPAVVGDNHFKATVTDVNGQPAEVQQITIKLICMEMSNMEEEVTLTDASQLEGDASLLMPGRWRAEYHVLLKSLDTYDGSFTFEAGAP
ncbi:copper resistance protein CopC [Paenibacillus physcomitrellae]|uniref:Copper transport protein YcnJ n=1 Tax=Paenibacillus physcomitrellae TaxID=1619311 RepID=A0ABQ1FUY5_9BACL|nr:copper resistance protein CopC [Paenibacillus physcomitrellae]GGA31123.1 copper transport protein YcnJ [Paenibacillus physcomitrellae]